MAKTIVWLRNDLRLHDHPALSAAASFGEVIPLFILPDVRHAVSDWWLGQSLLALKEQFQELGVELIVRKGEPLAQLADVQQESGAEALYFNECYDPVNRELEFRASELFAERKVEVRSFVGNVLIHPATILTQSGKPYKVLTPFWKKLRQLAISEPVARPEPLERTTVAVRSLAPHEWGLATDDALSAYWTPGELDGVTSWQTFKDFALTEYGQLREEPFAEGTSKLSPYLAWGNISVRSIMRDALAEVPDGRAETFFRQLAWREFGYYQLFFFPDMLNEPMRPEFRAFPWQPPGEMFDAWKEGRTGYPFVDAGMRQLLETGYIHNRVRMIAASFLVKQLLIDWRKGAEWFAEKLVDYDQANNALGWQWIAGSGFDAAPYFRVFNPIVQGEKFDPNGDYVKTWIPELEDVPFNYVHRPWEAPADVLEEAGVTLGLMYPQPIVDQRAARQRALAAYEECRNR